MSRSSLPLRYLSHCVLTLRVRLFVCATNRSVMEHPVQCNNHNNHSQHHTPLPTNPLTFVTQQVKFPVVDGLNFDLPSLTVPVLLAAGESVPVLPTSCYPVTTSTIELTILRPRAPATTPVASSAPTTSQPNKTLAHVLSIGTIFTLFLLPVPHFGVVERLRLDDGAGCDVHRRLVLLRV